MRKMVFLFLITIIKMVMIDRNGRIAFDSVGVTLASTLSSEINK